MLAGHARPAYQALRSCTCHPRYPLVRSKASFQAQRLSARLSHHADHSSVGSIGHTASSPSHIAPPHSSAHLRGRASALRSSVGVQSEETDQQTGGTAGLGDSPSPLSVGAATGRKMVAEQNHQAPTSYPKGWQDVFQKGVAISIWQNSSDEFSNWTHYMRKKNYFGQKDFVEAFQQSNDFWNKYDYDIQLVKSLGCNSFRFSFEWARIEPHPGQIDKSAIAQYHQILDSIDAAGLIPNATFHHFTHPQWFESDGGFANPANLPSFINYCKLIFHEFGVRIPFWATFNEPSCFCLCGHIMGLWAPGQIGRIGKAGKILGNMLQAHVEVYRALKQMPHGDVAQIGIVHQHIRFVPHCNALAGIIVRPVCRWMTYWFATQQMMDFFTTGRFKWVTPFGQTVVDYTMPEAVGALDWWGINYYSRPAINSWFQLVGLDSSEPVTGMGMPLVPSDLHHHLMDIHNRLRVPIIVSETGVSDESSVLRAQCISTYYNEILRAISDGADIRGVYYWTLMDNIEWHHGFQQHFGLYEWRPEANGNGGINRPTDGSNLSLRQGSKTLVELHHSWPETWRDMRPFAGKSFTNHETRVQIPSEAENAFRVPGVSEEQQQQLRSEVEQADQQRGVGVQEPLLGPDGGRGSDSV